MACYRPGQFQHAYDMNPLYRAGLTGKGRTIVLVDSFGSPKIKNDLATFDHVFHLPAPPSFRVIQPAGAVPRYKRTNFERGEWAIETTLDVEYAHAMAPGANIVLVETPVDETIGVKGFPSMIKAENYVIDHRLGDVISQSFGTAEETFPSRRSIYALRSAYFNALVHRVTVLSASGDAGATDESAIDTSDGDSNYFPFRVDSWPATDPLVTAVGGTRLRLRKRARTRPDSVWNDTTRSGGPAASGGGVSRVFERPSYQNAVAGTVGGARGTPDVSMSAAVKGAALVYISVVNYADGLVGPSFALVGGTSEATPLFAGIVAIADQAAGHDLGLLNPALYAIGDGPGSPLTDITAGNNSVFGTQQLARVKGRRFTVHGFRAVPGYDLASGLGTADGARLVRALAGFPG
ncbi:MAG: S53 family peptidase [Solirubrobacterales bacterium]|nr:S53 family peptidase [Solirubrobacterales bacterium]